MAQTPLTSATPYCTAAVMLAVHDPLQTADMLRDGTAPRPTRASMLDATSPAGSTLLTILLGASGELESAAVVGGRYTPADLQALTGSGQAYLQKLTADLAFWRLKQRRQPGAADPKAVPGAQQALEELDRLRDGVRIFPFRESADAGNPGVVNPAARPDVVERASRLFGPC